MSDVQFPSIDIFCRVIDNFGDAGVMWRLARAMRRENFRVRLIIDDPATLTYLAGVPKDCPPESIGKSEEITVIGWDKEWDHGKCSLEPADVVIEGFACRLPLDYEKRLALHPPKWFNIDYFSAEDWIEGCHLMPSIDPATGLVKINYFPGVTARSGGLIIERDYEKKEKAFKNQQRPGSSCKILFFAYPYGPIRSIAHALNHSDWPIELSVTQCEAGHLLVDALQSFDAQKVSIKNLPFVAQQDFDQLLWNSDVAFIRGEDSAARAMIAGVPFLWHIYHQDDDVHMVKLKALQKRYRPYFRDSSLYESWCNLQEALNCGSFDADLFKTMLSGIDHWKEATSAFSRDLRKLGSLSEKLSEIIKNG